MKMYIIIYLNLLGQKRTGIQKSICSEMAEIQFRLTHGVYKIISIEEE